MNEQQRTHIPRFFVDCELAVDATVSLAVEQSHHLSRVLRARNGDALTLFNGRGGEWSAQLIDADKGQATVSVQAHHPEDRESPLALTLAQGIARGDRMDQAIAKAVELGVTAIQPLFTARGKVKLQAERAAKKQAHWQRVAISAAEQSGRTRVPHVGAAMKFTQWLDTAPGANGLVLDPRAGAGLGGIARSTSATLLVGPESGLQDDEINRAIETGFQAINFGPRILRTETAGPACLAAVQTLWGDLG